MFPKRPAAIAMASIRAVVISGVCAVPSAAQFPLSTLRDSGQTVTPAFEGWYRNPDGSFSISFGYYNRNSREQLDIPIGPENFVQPGEANQGQPTHFEARRNWGVFAVTVPADFGEQRKVVWTLKVRGATFAIAGSLNPSWEIDALNGQTTTGNTPPMVRFAELGPSGQGPRGITHGPLAAEVGKPMRLSAWVTDDGKGWIGAFGTNEPAVVVAWSKHQGAGNVTFSPVRSRLTENGGKAETAVTFSEPGDYVVRARVNDSPAVVAGNVQCCWTNGFVKVKVIR